MGQNESAVADLLEVTAHEMGVADWRAAGVLAGLRRATNEQRSADRDRGDALNILNDTLGAITELVAIRACEGLESVAVRHSLLDLSGPVAHEADLVLVRRRELRLEAKGHFLEAHKRRFAINERAHARSRRRHAEGYVPIIGRKGSPHLVSGRIVRMRDVDEWSTETLGRYGDPAVTLPLHEAIRRYFGMQPSMLEDEVGKSDPDRMEAAGDGERIGFQALGRARREGLALPGSSSEIVRVLNAFARRDEAGG